VSILNRSSLDKWTVPGPRLPALVEWLTGEVWTADRFVSSGSGLIMIAGLQFLLVAVITARREHRLHSRSTGTGA
jgi:hypothetical protein